MPHFRRNPQALYLGRSLAEIVPELIREMFRPAHFFLGPELELRWESVVEEELPWEIFQGRLLDPAHTRRRRAFSSWKVYAATRPEEERPGEPLLALLHDPVAKQLHVVRGLDSYVWEGYDAGGSVYLSRERRKWVRELVATLALDQFADGEELRDELACVLFQAVVGISRLPLTSVETPLPAFSFGQLFYCYRPDAPATGEAVRGWRSLLSAMLQPGLNPRENAHLLETFLHAVASEEMKEGTTTLLRRWQDGGRTGRDLLALLRTLFNEVSLSPFTDLTDKTLTFVRTLEQEGVIRIEEVIDFLSHLLRQLGRHLTAFNLVLFHHRGANYPDALLLDAVLKEYRGLLERRPELFLDQADETEQGRQQKRLRRRALRQGWLLRRHYEGHAVPDLPTSPGENMRVLPPSHPRVPEEQITQPARRTRCLNDGNSLLPCLQGNLAEILNRSFLDLEHGDEWREMGLGLFLDRPLGVGKAAAEPDSTLLLSAEAFSPSLATDRVRALANDLSINSEESGMQRILSHPKLAGLPLDAIGDAVRPGTVSLADARRAARDFVFLRSTRSSVKALLEQFDFTPLASRFRLEDLLQGADMLIASSAQSDGLMIYDEQLRPRLEVEVITEEGFERRGGQEYPRGGLRVRRVWEGESVQDLTGQQIFLLPHH